MTRGGPTRAGSLIGGSLEPWMRLGTDLTEFHLPNSFQYFKLLERARTRGMGIAFRLHTKADFLERTAETFGTPKAEFRDGDRFNFLE